MLVTQDDTDGGRRHALFGQLGHLVDHLRQWEQQQNGQHAAAVVARCTSRERAAPILQRMHNARGQAACHTSSRDKRQRHTQMLAGQGKQRFPKSLTSVGVVFSHDGALRL